MISQIATICDYLFTAFHYENLIQVKYSIVLAFCHHHINKTLKIPKSTLRELFEYQHKLIQNYTNVLSKFLDSQFHELIFKSTGEVCKFLAATSPMRVNKDRHPSCKCNLTP